MSNGEFGTGLSEEGLRGRAGERAARPALSEEGSREAERGRQERVAQGRARQLGKVDR